MTYNPRRHWCVHCHHRHGNHQQTNTSHATHSRSRRRVREPNKMKMPEGKLMRNVLSDISFYTSPWKYGGVIHWHSYQYPFRFHFYYPTEEYRCSIWPPPPFYTIFPINIMSKSLSLMKTTREIPSTEYRLHWLCVKIRPWPCQHNLQSIILVMSSTTLTNDTNMQAGDSDWVVGEIMRLRQITSK